MSEQEELGWGERSLHDCALAGLCLVLFAEHLITDFVIAPPRQRAQHRFWRFNCKYGKEFVALCGVLIRRLLVSVEDIHFTFVSTFTIIQFFSSPD